jgi:hypothetical protein
MKRAVICTMVVLFAGFLCDSCLASTAGTPIVLVDGSKDLDLKVSFTISTAIGSVGYSFSGSDYNLSSGNSVELNGGDKIDFYYIDGNGKHYLDEATNIDLNVDVSSHNGDAYFNDSVSTTPPGMENWYRSITVVWFNNYSLNLEAATAGGGNDGFALSSTIPPGGGTVPIPASAFLLGTGAIGLIGIRRKFMK